VVIVVAASIAKLWNSNADFSLKSAGLVAAAMLSTPYLNGYDFPVLIIALAFLYRERRFDSVEWTLAVLVNLVTAGFLLQIAPLGPFAILLVAAMIARRLLAKSAPADQGSVNAAPAFG
jgi:hypothetical protein